MAAVAERATLARRLRRWEGLPYWLILPTLAYLAIFFAWPMIKSFQLAFQEDGDWTLQLRGVADAADSPETVDTSASLLQDGMNKTQFRKGMAQIKRSSRR